MQQNSRVLSLSLKAFAEELESLVLPGVETS